MSPLVSFLVRILEFDLMINKPLILRGGMSRRAQQKLLTETSATTNGLIRSLLYHKHWICVLV